MIILPCLSWNITDIDIKNYKVQEMSDKFVYTQVFFEKYNAGSDSIGLLCF